MTEDFQAIRMMPEVTEPIRWMHFLRSIRVTEPGYRSVALIIENADGSTACDLRYRSHQISNGKYKIPGLPAVYAEETESQTLEITMEDVVTGVEVTLLYGVLPDYDVITRSAKIAYHGDGKIFIQKAQSACLDFLYGKYDLLTFYGRHAMERRMQREPVTHGAM